MTNRPTLRLKRTAAADVALDELLDQPSRTDPLHPHMAAKASEDVPNDWERLQAILTGLAQRAATDQALNPRTADQAVGEASQLLRKIGNAASNKSEVR
jgi:hypothetical protein